MPTQKNQLFLVLFAVSVLIFISIYTQSASAFNYSDIQLNKEDYKGVSYCEECHPDEVEKWHDSVHSIAYNEPNFQNEWISLGKPESCLQCHTTGYNKNDGTYVFEDVTCEQCHGPGDTMSVDKTVNLCAKCHSGLFPTYEEWIRSGPGHTNATCNLCHTPHSQQLKGKTSTDVCAQCHQSHVDELESTAHGEAELECKICHMYETPADFKNNIPAKTGHTFFMTPSQLDCTTCHNRTLSKHDVLGEKAAACLTCHGDIHNLRLKLVNGTTYPLDNSVALCGECHNARLVAWESGTHGSPTEKFAPCVECHNPHDPIVAGISILDPLPDREPAPSPPVEYIAVVAMVVGVLLIASIALRRKI